MEMMLCEDGILSSRTQYTLKSMLIVSCNVEGLHRSEIKGLRAEFVLSPPVGLEVLVPREGMPPPGHASLARIPLDFKQRLPLSNVGFLHQERESAFCLRS